MSHRFWTWVKWISLSVSIGSIGLAIALMAFRDHGMRQTQTPGPEKGGQTRVEKPLIVERKGDRLVWRLKADKAEQQLQGTLLLTRPVLEMFTDNGEVVTVSGARARFDPLRRNIAFDSQVKVAYQQWRLTSDSLVYVSSKDELTIPGEFVASSDKIVARGKGLRVQRDSQQLWVDHGIRIEDRGSAWTEVRP
ncbi:MAG TPA: LPS export ABC transporter periplasmic protein LptC [Mariprofundaceae bacterium]|nr:LPS export ABC transporter periplasmic protein LptC [Mariprofundaceae bacterium]